MEDETTFLRDPTIVFMTALLADVKRGAIQLPRFQRESVWMLRQRIDLLDSVYRGIPIGSILLWRTDTRLATRQRVGRHVVPSDKGTSPRQYILDGGQRIATLLGALYAKEPTSTGQADDSPSDDAGDIYFDLAEEAFKVHRSRDVAVAPPTFWLPLPDALHTVKLLKFQRALSSDDAEEVDAWVSRADQLATRFRAYKVPVIMLASENLDIATTTFQRVNSTGTPMSDSDMVNALTWSETFDLQREIEQFRDDLLEPIGWQGLDDEAWLRCIKGVLGLELYAGVEATRKALREHPDTVGRAASSLVRVAHFLRESCQVDGPGLVPYAHQIPLLAMAFDRAPSPSGSLLERLQAWLWLTTYAELFAGISGNGVRRVQVELEHLVQTGELRWPEREAFQHRTLPQRFDFRHARARALALRLAADSATANGPAMLERDGAEAMIRLAPRNDGAQSPGNRLFAPGASRLQLLDELREASVRVAHHISDEAWACWTDGDQKGFATRRTSDLDVMERGFVERWSRLLVQG